MDSFLIILQRLVLSRNTQGIKGLLTINMVRILKKHLVLELK